MRRMTRRIEKEGKVKGGQEQKEQKEQQEQKEAHEAQHALVPVADASTELAVALPAKLRNSYFTLNSQKHITISGNHKPVSKTKEGDHIWGPTIWVNLWVATYH